MRRFAAVAAFIAASAAHVALAEPVARVHDGDTLTLASGAKIRLYGIDAPELHQECTGANGRPWRCGALAAGRLREMTAGRDVRCDTRDTDRYGRSVAVCYVGRTDLGRALVRAGLAEAYRRYSTDYVSDEGEAKRRRLGIWAGQHQQPEAWRRQR